VRQQKAVTLLKNQRLASAIHREPACALVLLLSRFNVGPLKALFAPGWRAKPTNLFVKFGSQAPR
jgi:hypothetical protein